MISLISEEINFAKKAEFGQDDSRAIMAILGGNGHFDPIFDNLELFFPKSFFGSVCGRF